MSLMFLECGTSGSWRFVPEGAEVASCQIGTFSSISAIQMEKKIFDTKDLVILGIFGLIIQIIGFFNF